MNIFYLSHDPKLCAQYHTDKHVVKMISEYIQLLSTAHRLLDGVPTLVESGTSKNGAKSKSKTMNVLPGEQPVYKEIEVMNDDGGPPEWWYEFKLRIHGQAATAATHQNHPSAVWTRASAANYAWLWQLTVELHTEWLYRYHDESKTKEHKLFADYKKLLQNPPKNIPAGEFTQPTPAMPDDYIKENDSLTSYKQYYAGRKYTLAKWKRRGMPDWYMPLIVTVWKSIESEADRIAYITDEKTSKKTEITLEGYAEACKSFKI